MELKQSTSNSWQHRNCLLIVPYGIETNWGMCNIPDWVLLIVPYGIETNNERLLIIITFKLLIVPYGIETLQQNIRNIRWKSFNRTLWNWNRVDYCQGNDFDMLLIVPYGIETWENSSIRQDGWTFNRTLWNWNSKAKAAKAETQTF